MSVRIKQATVAVLVASALPSISRASTTTVLAGLLDETRVKDSTRTMTFTSVEYWPGREIRSIEVYTPIPPSTGTQDGLGYSVQIIPQSGEKIPTTSVEEQDKGFFTSEGKQPGHFVKWTRHPNDPAYTTGFKVVVTQKADLYRYLRLPREVPETVPGTLQPNKFADFTVPIVMNWGNTIASVPAEDPALGAAAGVMRAVHSAIRYTGEVEDPATRGSSIIRKKDDVEVFGEVGIQRASKVLKSQAGDCGSFCNLFQAGMLGMGYGTRVVAGWNFAGLLLARHARAEVTARGVWVPVDPTFAHGVDPFTCIGTGQYVQAEKFFTNHLGLGVYVDITDKAGNVRVIEQANLQRPYIRVSVTSKVNDGQEVYWVPGPWVVTAK